MKINNFSFARGVLVSLFFLYLFFSPVVFAMQGVERKEVVTQEPSLDEQKPQEITDAEKQKVEDVKAEAEAIEKEVELQKKAVELEKKKAELEAKEAEAAKKEAQILQEGARSKIEAEKAAQRVAKEEAEAQAASKKVAVAQEKVVIAEEKAKLSQEELAIAKEKAAIDQIKIIEKRKVLYRKLIQTGSVVLSGYLLILIVVGIINRKVKELRAKHVLRKNFIYLTYFFMILLIILVWLQDVSSITIIFSVVGAGLALALQEVILSVAGWFLILIRRPFEVGDRVELGGVKGDVIDIRLFQTSMLEIGNWVGADQSTGRIVNVPNSAIFKKENFNYSRGFEFIWNEIKVLVTFESDWKRAEEIMLSHAVEHAEEMESVIKRKIDIMAQSYMIHYDKFRPIVYVDIKDSGVELSLRYLTEARSRRTTHDDLCRHILSDFEKEEKVNFAYTTYRIVK